MADRPDFAQVAEWAAVLTEMEIERLVQDPAYEPYSEEDLLTLAWLAAATAPHADPYSSAFQQPAPTPVAA